MILSSYNNAIVSVDLSIRAKPGEKMENMKMNFLSYSDF